MDSLGYLIVKFLHEFLTIVAVGFNLSYGIWFGRAGRRPEDLGFALRGVKVLDDRFANPAYVLLGVTGGIMIVIGDLSPSTPWLAVSMVLWLVAVVVAYTVYTPALRASIAVVEAALTPTAAPVGASPADAGGPPDRQDAFDQAAYDRAAGRVALVGRVLGALIVAILVLMVFKPGE